MKKSRPGVAKELGTRVNSEEERGGTASSVAGEKKAWSRENDELEAKRWGSAEHRAGQKGATGGHGWLENEHRPQGDEDERRERDRVERASRIFIKRRAVAETNKQKKLEEISWEATAGKKNPAMGFLQQERAARQRIRARALVQKKSQGKRRLQIRLRRFFFFHWIDVQEITWRRY
jgi:hypothetical protein